MASHDLLAELASSIPAKNSVYHYHLIGGV